MDHYGNIIIDISGGLWSLKVINLMKVCFYCTSTSSLIKSNLHNGKLLHFHVSNFPSTPPSLSFLLLLPSVAQVLFAARALKVAGATAWVKNVFNNLCPGSEALRAGRFVVL